MRTSFVVTVIPCRVLGIFAHSWRGSQLSVSSLERWEKTRGLISLERLIPQPFVPQTFLSRYFAFYSKGYGLWSFYAFSDLSGLILMGPKTLPETMPVATQIMESMQFKRISVILLNNQA